LIHEAMGEIKMHFAIEVVPFGDYADPRNVLRLAQAAEAAGWKGLFTWDHIGFVWGAPASDPWVTLSAVAAVTERLKLGFSITPLPRRRPQVVAQALSSLDLLSQGRVIFGVGLGGVAEEYTAFGEPGEVKTRAAMLDEGLEVLDRLWSGEAVSYHGKYYTVENLTFTPLPAQRPRIPVWVGGDSPPAMRRAARWDGWIPIVVDEQGNTLVAPEQLAEKIAAIRLLRPAGAPFDVLISGYTEPGSRGRADDYAAAGVTWWMESLHGYRGDMEAMLRRVKEGPPV
jgi:probable F420-dependent oxidoreductase